MKIGRFLPPALEFLSRKESWLLRGALLRFPPPTLFRIKLFSPLSTNVFFFPLNGHLLKFLFSLGVFSQPTLPRPGPIFPLSRRFSPFYNRDTANTGHGPLTSRAARPFFIRILSRVRQALLSPRLFCILSCAFSFNKGLVQLRTIFFSPAGHRSFLSPSC